MANSEYSINQVETFISAGSDYGMLRSCGKDHGVWLYAEIPWGEALLNGASPRLRSENANQMMVFFDGLAGEVNATLIKYRNMIKGDYREFHLLSTAMPIRYSPPPSMRSQPDLSRWLARNYADGKYNVQKQHAWIGVKLKPGGNLTGNNRRADMWTKALVGLDRLAYSVHNGIEMLEEFEPDMKRIANIMRNAGLRPLCDMDYEERARTVSEMQSWWVSRGNANALPVVAENDHLHLFPDTERCAQAVNLWNQKVDCSDWNIMGEYPATICYARSSQFANTPIDSASSQWIARLMAVSSAGGANAVGVSIRGKVEPGVCTADAIRRNAATIEENIKNRYKHGQSAPGEMEDNRERLEYKKAIYRQPDMPPTLIDLSIGVLAAGRPEDALESLKPISQIDFVNMNTAKEQLFGFKSMQVCSPFRVTPYELHWSATTVAGGGVNSMGNVGDKDGAMLGETEANRRPVYVNPRTVQDENTTPYFIIVGKPGSGKSMALVSLMIQFSKIINARSGQQTCSIIINPKQGNDFEKEVLNQNGNVIRLDSDVSDGAFDPFNIMPNTQEAKNMASIMLSNILHPNGDDAASEIAMQTMLDYGLKHGAKCCGVALALANHAYLKEANHAGLPDLTPQVFRTVNDAVKTNQSLRLICGTTNNVQPLKVSNGLTLINAGEVSLVPAADSASTFTGRIQQWVLRLVVLGAGAAVRGRDGMVALDEAWVAVDGSKGTGATLKEWERMARSQRFTPILASQKVKEFIDAGLEGGISRMLMLALDDVDESHGAVSQAKAALRLAAIDDKDGTILRRMSQPAKLNSGMPNWNSLYALFDPKTKENIRGSVGYFVDNGKAPVPVEITIAKDVLANIRTDARAKDMRENTEESK